MAGIAGRNIEYNQDNKPIEITYAGGTTTYLSYDGEGNRIKKVQGSNAVTYVGDIYEVREGEALSYIYANGKKIVTLTDDHEYYTHSDHLGSTSIVTDENGDAVEEIGYLPFGAVLFRNVYNGGTWESAYKFTGQEHDAEYELYNYNARLYDPVMGRFITPDTIVPDTYNPQSLNRYSYCLNNPLVYIDPTGHSGYYYVDEFSLEEIEEAAEKLKKEEEARKNQIVLDPGHGDHNDKNTKVDPGSGQNPYEKDLVLKLSQEISAKLEEKGYNTTLTRTGDVDPAGARLKWRIDKAQAAGGSIFISVHMNSSKKTTANGFEVFHNSKGKELAESINNNVSIFPTKRGVSEDTSLYVLNHFNGPAVLIESGFISNKNDQNIMVNKSGEVANQIVNGIDSYLIKNK